MRGNSREATARGPRVPAGARRRASAPRPPLPPSPSPPPGRQPRGADRPPRAPALLAAALAATYLALAFQAPACLLVATPVAMGAACALATARRPRWRAAAIVTAWLALGVAGAWWWRAEAATGLWWVVGALFLLPLPIAPWLYARWFGEPA